MVNMGVERALLSPTMLNFLRTSFLLAVMDERVTYSLFDLKSEKDSQLAHHIRHELPWPDIGLTYLTWLRSHLVLDIEPAWLGSVQLKLAR